MKTLFALITLLVFVQPAFAELTPDDIQIIREEVTNTQLTGFVARGPRALQC